jgi:hypothetical protein
MPKYNNEQTFDSHLYNSQEKKNTIIKRQNEIESKKLSLLLKCFQNEHKINLNLCALRENKFIKYVKNLQNNIDCIKKRYPTEIVMDIKNDDGEL